MQRCKSSSTPSTVQFLVESRPKLLTTLDARGRSPLEKCYYWGAAGDPDFYQKIHLMTESWPLACLLVDVEGCALFLMERNDLVCDTNKYLVRMLEVATAALFSAIIIVSSDFSVEMKARTELVWQRSTNPSSIAEGEQGQLELLEFMANEELQGRLREASYQSMVSCFIRTEQAAHKFGWHADIADEKPFRVAMIQSLLSEDFLDNPLDGLFVSLREYPNICKREESMARSDSPVQTKTSGVQRERVSGEHPAAPRMRRTSIKLSDSQSFLFCLSKDIGSSVMEVWQPSARLAPAGNHAGPRISCRTSCE